ncbi:MAG: glycine cleavage system protein H [Melioribacteraceae bacterium]|nr:glycine cleavage system protein H [Melioribacteraceae bacterium]
MEGFHQVDLFATKGIEYILVIGFLVAFTLYIKYLNGTPKKLRQKVNEFEPQLSLVDWFYLAKDYLYHQGHSWVLPQGATEVKIGVDDFLQKMVGKPDKINLPDVGAAIYQNKVGWNFEIDNKTIDILAPIDGKVLEINKEVLNNPELLNKNSYKDGWLMKVEVKNLPTQKKVLFTGNLAKAWIEDTIENVNLMMNGEPGVVMQDGGSLMPGFIKEISKENWHNEIKKFLLTE